MISNGNLKLDYYGQVLNQVVELIVEVGLLTNKMNILDQLQD